MKACFVVVPMWHSWNLYRYFHGRQLVLAINLAAGLSIFFFGVCAFYSLLLCHELIFNNTHHHHRHRGILV